MTADTPAPDRVKLTIALDPMVALMLDALARHLGKSRDETIAAALRVLYSAVPRVGE